MTYKEISIGARDSGDEENVKTLQQLLNQTGNYQLQEDGIFDINTQNAVKTYQQANNLTADGVVGQQTWSSLTKTSYSDYAKQLEELYDAWSEREPFAYDTAADPLYQQYKDLYTRQGQLAMLDTVGQAAALTGGYGNSYGQTAGQLAFQDYMQKLSAAVPELYGAAYDRYQEEGDRLLQKYTVTKELADTAYAREKAEEETAYQRQQDELKWQKAEEEAAYQRQQDELKWQKAEEEAAYQREQDALKRQQAEEAAAYQREQDALKRQQAEEAEAYERLMDRYNRLYELLSYGYSPTDQELADVGMTRSQADAILGAYYAKTANQSSKTGSSGGYNTHGYTTEEIKALQTAAGITVDGIWGPETEKAYSWYSGQTDTTGTRTAAQFKGYVLTRREFSRTSGQYGSYEDYIQQKLKEWGNSLSLADVREIAKYYQLPGWA